MSVLNKLVSYFPSVSLTSQGVDTNLLTILNSTRHKDKILNVRATEGEAQKVLKELLPCFTVAGTFSRRCIGGIKQLSGLAPVDFDSAEDYDKIYLLNELKQIPSIAYAGLSCRENRLWAIVPFLYPDKYEKHYERLMQSFVDWGLPMGDDCHKQISQPRFVSCNDDSTQFFYHNAAPYHLLPAEKTYHFIKPQSNPKFTGQPSDKFQFAASILNKQSCLFVDGNKHIYLYNLCRLLNKMGATKSEAEEYISTFFSLNQITTNCITGPFSHYAKEFNTWNFQTQNSLENSFTVEQPAPVQHAEAEQPETISDAPAPAIFFENFQKTEVKLQPVKWEEEIIALEMFFASATLPQSIQLNNHTFIEDVPKFIDSHLATLNSNSGNRIFEPYLIRLFQLKSIMSNLIDF